MWSCRLLRGVVGAGVALVILLGSSVEIMAQECPGLAVINCGHRGTGSKSDENDYPENTLPSFLQAEAEGADSIMT